MRDSRRAAGGRRPARGWLALVVGALFFGVASAADRPSDPASDPVPDPAKIRECSAWCVTSYRGAISESISCIDSCQRGYPNHPVALCGKRCVGSHAGDVSGIADCIHRCGAR